MLLDYFNRACEACGNSQTPHILTEAFDFHNRFVATGTMEK
jgi:succinyl-CoA:acetate CoA-transferase